MEVRAVRRLEAFILFLAVLVCQAKAADLPSAKSECDSALLSHRQEDESAQEILTKDLNGTWSILLQSKNYPPEVLHAQRIKFLVQVRAQLDKLGIEYEPTADGESFIISVQGNSGWNRIASSVQRNLGGTRIILSPLRLIDAGNGALYDPEANTILAPIEMVTAPQRGRAMLAHEIKHRDFHFKLIQGRGGLNGWYADYRTGHKALIEELYNYALEMKALSSALRDSSADEKAKILKRIGLNSKFALDEYVPNILRITQDELGAIEQILDLQSPWKYITWGDVKDQRFSHGWQGPDGRFIAFNKVPIRSRADHSFMIQAELFSRYHYFQYTFTDENDGEFMDQMLSQASPNLEERRRFVDLLKDKLQRVFSLASNAKNNLEAIHALATSNQTEALSAATTQFIREMRALSNF